MNKDVFTKFLQSCGDQYIADNILDMDQTIAIDNFVDFLIEKYYKIAQINDIIQGKRKTNEK